MCVAERYLLGEEARPDHPPILLNRVRPPTPRDAASDHPPTKFGVSELGPQGPPRQTKRILGGMEVTEGVHPSLLVRLDSDDEDPSSLPKAAAKRPQSSAAVQRLQTVLTIGSSYSIPRSTWIQWKS